MGHVQTGPCTCVLGSDSTRTDQKQPGLWRAAQVGLRKQSAQPPSLAVSSFTAFFFLFLFPPLFFKPNSCSALVHVGSGTEPKTSQPQARKLLCTTLIHRLLTGSQGVEQGLSGQDSNRRGSVSRPEFLLPSFFFLLSMFKYSFETEIYWKR